MLMLIRSIDRSKSKLGLVFLLRISRRDWTWKFLLHLLHILSLSSSDICLAEFSYFDYFLAVNCSARFQESFTVSSELITCESSLYPHHLLISTTVCQHLCIIQLCSDSLQHVWQFTLFSLLKIGSLLKVGLASRMQILTHFLVKQ